MKTRNLLNLFFLLVGLFAQNSLAQQFTPPNDGFTAWLNGKPSPQIRSVDSDVGKISIKFYLVATPNGAHGVAVNQYPIATEDSATIESRIDAGIESLLTGRKAKKVSEKVVSLGEHKGKEVYFSFAGGVGRVKVFLVKYNLYQIISLGKSSYVNSTLMSKVFNSFKLTEGNIGEKWTLFTSNATGFATSFPTKPQISTKKIGSDGNKTLSQNTFSVGSESEEYGVVVTDIRKELTALPKDQILDYLRSSVDPSLNGEKRIIVIDDEQGIEFFVEIGGKKTKIWSAIKYDKSYQIFFRGSEEKLASEEVKSFFESFKFINPSPAKAKKKGR